MQFKSYQLQLLSVAQDSTSNLLHEWKCKLSEKGIAMVVSGRDYESPKGGELNKNYCN